MSAIRIFPAFISVALLLACSATENTAVPETVYELTNPAPGKVTATEAGSDSVRYGLPSAHSVSVQTRVCDATGHRRSQFLSGEALYLRSVIHNHEQFDVRYTLNSSGPGWQLLSGSAEQARITASALPHQNSPHIIRAGQTLVLSQQWQPGRDIHPGIYTLKGRTALNILLPPESAKNSQPVIATVQDSHLLRLSLLIN